MLTFECTKIVVVVPPLVLLFVSSHAIFFFPITLLAPLLRASTNTPPPPLHPCSFFFHNYHQNVFLQTYSTTYVSGGLKSIQFNSFLFLLLIVNHETSFELTSRNKPSRLPDPRSSTRAFYSWLLCGCFED